MFHRMRIAAAIIAVSFGTVLYAATPAEKIAERQENFKAVGRANKAIRDELAKPAPNLAVINNNARTLHVTARRIGWLFGRDTGPQSGVRTGALPIIWTQFPDFRSKHIAFTNAARDLEAAARTNNAATVRTALATLGGTCKACHDVYRKKD
jgi:cytochrome c556